MIPRPKNLLLIERETTGQTVLSLEGVESYMVPENLCVQGSWDWCHIYIGVWSHFSLVAGS